MKDLIMFVLFMLFSLGLSYDFSTDIEIKIGLVFLMIVIISFFRIGSSAMRESDENIRNIQKIASDFEAKTKQGNDNLTEKINKIL